jgi:hypothetical protein
MTWQPIETAPKDTAILIYSSGYNVAHYNTAYERWCTYTDGRGTAGERLLNSWDFPTHWMPLPAPPET